MGTGLGGGLGAGGMGCPGGAGTGAGGIGWGSAVAVVSRGEILATTR